MFKLKTVNGRVNCLLKTGNDYVKNQLSSTAAQHIIDTGKLTKSDVNGYPICVDSKWYFEGEKIVRKKDK